LELKLKICPNCQAQNVFEGAQFCKDCGAPLNEMPAPAVHRQEPESDNNPDFVVTESIGTGDPQFVGIEGSRNKSRNPEDDLEIKTTANLLDDEAAGDDHSADQRPKSVPIGESAPPIPTVSEYDEADTQKKGAGPLPSNGKEKAEIKKLSEKELADITRNLYGTDKSAAEKAESSTRRNNGFETGREPVAMAASTPAAADQNGIRPIQDPALAAGIQKTHKVRGVAYFKKNFIQIMGNPYLHVGDELIINEKHYLLKPKRISQNMAIGFFATILAIILFLVGSQFINPTVSGNGEMVGLILNQEGRPYLEGARVTIPSLNKSTSTNSQGFFRFEMIPTGTYNLVYDLGDNYTGRGNITVTAGQTTLMTFSDFALKVNPPTGRSETGGTGVTETIPNRPTENNRAKQSETRSRTQSGYATIELMANIADARLTIDDKIMGAGNNTYTRIKAGHHKIKVDKPGYSEYRTEIELASDQRVAITANLNPVSSSAQASASAENYVTLGNLAMGSNDYKKAIIEYSKAIEQVPNFKDAYAKRAEAYGKSGENGKAVEDYVRLGEIYRVSGNNVKAVEAFSSALTFDTDSKIALVGRAGARLDKGDYSPALTDYQAALKMDEQFYPALFGSGICHFKLGNNKQADKYFKNAYKINQGDPFLFQYMMLNYLALDDVKKLRKTYAEYKAVANQTELAEFKSSSRFAPVIRLINEEDR
jgi:tetratricopeptide (TPR) repeat protein